MKNYLSTILAQYSNSPIMLQMIGQINAAIDQSGNIDAFYNNVWNIETAQGYGLDVWGRIVGINRQLTIPAAARYLGFEEGLPSYDPLGQSPLWSGTPATQAYSIEDGLYRELILIKALMNISRTTISLYNTVLMSLFPGRGNAYVSDVGWASDYQIATFGFAEAHGDGLVVGFNQGPLYGAWDQPPVYLSESGMTIRFTTEFLLEPLEIAILQQSGLIVAPTGVASFILDYDLPGGVWGFKEAGPTAQPFGQGALWEGFAIPDVANRGSGILDKNNSQIIDQNGFAITSN